MSEAGSSNKYGDRMQRLRELHQRRTEARKQNHSEVVEEDRRSKLPENFEQRKRRQEYQLDEIEKKKAAEAQGQDYDRIKMLDVQADIADKIDLAKKRKKNPDNGFADFEGSTMRQYTRLTKNMKPDMKDYAEMRAVVPSEEFFPTSNTLITGTHYPSKDAIDKMVGDVKQQEEKKAKFSRRRTYDPEAHVDFINERNRKFNDKIERFYNKYTDEIKQNLERGTAV